MKLYIDTNTDKFDLWDFLNLNSDIFDVNFTDIKVPTEENGKTKDKKIDTIEVSLKPLKKSYKRITYYSKMFETLKLYLKTHDEKNDDMDWNPISWILKSTCKKPRTNTI